MNAQNWGVLVQLRAPNSCLNGAENPFQMSTISPRVVVFVGVTLGYLKRQCLLIKQYIYIYAVSSLPG
jgi:hypothetical protein